MLETIYEKKQMEEKEQRPVRLPYNRRQMGQPQQAETEVFIEDYAFSFAKGLAERDYTGCVVGVLVGSYVSASGGDKVLVRGVLEARDVLVHDAVCFTEENWAGIYRDIRDYFPDQQIVGWYLGGPGFLLEDEERQKKIQADYFGGGDKILLKVDSIEKEQSVLYYKEGRMQKLPGYYIYYEKNAEMQNYMMGTRQTIPSEEKVKYPVREIKEEPVLTRNHVNTGSLYQLFYMTGGILTCLAILIIAGLALQIQERNRLESLLNEQSLQASSFRQVYVVEEGDTLESICIKLYGDTKREADLRTLNGLDAEEEPVVGQKLFLP